MPTLANIDTGLWLCSGVCGAAMLVWLVVGTVVGTRRLKRNKRIARGYCPTCRYDFAGSLVVQCPECGYTLTESEHKRLERMHVALVRVREEERGGRDG